MRYRTACKARFRLVASPCREGVEPSGFHRKVSIRYIGLPPFPGLSWRYRKSPAEIHDCLLRDFGRPLALSDPVISLLRPWTERLRVPRASSHHGRRAATESNGRRLQARNHKQFVMVPGCRNATLCSRVRRISTSGPSRRLARNTRRKPPTSFHGDLRCPPKVSENRGAGQQVTPGGTRIAMRHNARVLDLSRL